MQKDSTLFPRLRIDSLKLPREARLRLLAHEIEHARQRSKEPTVYLRPEMAGAEPVSDEWSNKFARMQIHPQYSELLNRIECQCELLITNDKSSLAMPIDHYLTGSEVLARLRAYQVHLLMPSETTMSHELIEICTADDLKWLDETHIDLICSDLTPKPGIKWTLGERPFAK